MKQLNLVILLAFVLYNNISAQVEFQTNDFELKGSEILDIEIGDLNGDLRPDLYISAKNAGYIQALINTESGFQLEDYFPVENLEFTYIAPLNTSFPPDMVYKESGSNLKTLYGGTDGYFSEKDLGPEFDQVGTADVTQITTFPHYIGQDSRVLTNLHFLMTDEQSISIWESRSSSFHSIALVWQQDITTPENIVDISIIQDTVQVSGLVALSENTLDIYPLTFTSPYDWNIEEPQQLMNIAGGIKCKAFTGQNGDHLLYVLTDDEIVEINLSQNNTTRTISLGLNDVNDFDIGDIDGEGDLDIVVAAGNQLWKFTDEVTRSDKGLLFNGSNKITQVHLIDVDNNGLSDIWLTMEGTTSINMLELRPVFTNELSDQDMWIGPNPTQGNIDMCEGCKIEAIYDSAGRTLDKEHTLSNGAAGLYYIRVSKDGREKIFTLSKI